MDKSVLGAISPLAKGQPLIHLSTDFIRAKEYLEAIITSTTDAICTTDLNGRIIYFSPGAEHMLAAKSESMAGSYVRDLYVGGMEEAQRIMRLLRRRGNLQNYETVCKTSDGRRLHVSMSISLLRDRSGQIIGTLGISKDITSRVELENKLRELSVTDTLTGLYNRRCFRERLIQETSRARRQRGKLSLIAMDLDDFKKVNDACGHLAGDRLLKAFSALLMQSIRKDVDMAFRCGGDEFLLLLPGLAEKRALVVAGRIARTAQASKELIGFSYGVASLSANASIADLMHKADCRMYRMKAARKKPGPPASGR